MSPEGMRESARVLDRLPRTVVLQAEWRAERAQRLAPMPTTSLHGALGHAIRDLACRTPSRRGCDGCRHRGECSYAILFEPEGSHEHGEGVHGRAPPPLVLRPLDMSPGAPCHELAAGGVLRARVGLIGEAAIAQEALVKASLARVGRVGLARAQGETRPPLALESVARQQPSGARPRSGLWRIRFVTPLRLTEDGKPAARITASLLWKSIVRRADTLSRRYGKGALPLDPGECPWRQRASEQRPVRVRRYSSRQGQRMEWPAVMGWIDVDGEAGELAEHATRVQVGKGTGFGFGGVEVEPEVQ